MNMQGHKAKLMYLYVCENEIFDKIEINFTNDYIISLNESKTKITVIKNKNKGQNIEDLYSKYIQNISVLVGINGSGKSTLMNYIGMEDVETNFFYDKPSYFLIYAIDKAWYMEINDSQKRFDFFEDKERDYVDRHWQRVEYNEISNKMTVFYDTSYDFIMPSIREEYNKIKILYYKDKSAELTGWTKSCGVSDNEYDNVIAGPQSTIERYIIKNNIYDIYYFMTHKSQLVRNSLKKIRNIGCNLILNTDRNHYIRWEHYKEDDCKNTFIIQLLYNLCTNCCEDSEELISLRQEFYIHNNSNLPNISNYESYIERLLSIYNNTYSYDKLRIYELINALEKVDNFYFEKRDNIYVKYGEISGEIISFSIEEDYNQDLYEMLQCLSVYNDWLSSYQIFSYQYDYISAGEAKCIDIFSGIYQAIKRNEDALKNKSLILLLDEPDTGLHPELARKFVSIINDFSEELGLKYNCSFQYIISTHSPFLMLDVPGTNVHRMKIEDGKTYIESGEEGIMSNVVDLMKDTFFLESIFGELSEKFFKSVQKEILELPEDVSYEKIEAIKSKIEIINELSLKNYLYTKLENMLDRLGAKETLLMYYQRKIEELKKDD